MKGPTHYNTLGVPSDADPDAIKRAYRSLIRQVHTDVAGAVSQDAAARVIRAYEILSRPDSRAAYDREIAATATAPPLPADEGEPEPEDTWGEEADWGVPESTGSPSPAPDAGPRQAPVPEEVEDSPTDDTAVILTPLRSAVPSLLLGALVLTALAIGAPLTVATMTSGQRLLAMLLLPVGGLVLGAWLGSRRPLGFLAYIVTLGVTCGIGFVIGGPAAAYVMLLTPLLAGAALGESLTTAVARQRRANAVLGRKALRVSDTFGRGPGGVVNDLLNRDLLQLLALPGARVVRVPEANALFTHAVVCGDRVALLRAVIAPAGTLRWSGPTLLHEREGQAWPEEILTAQYSEHLTRITGRLGKRVHVQSWLIVYTREVEPVRAWDVAGMPKVREARLGMTEAGRYLAQDGQGRLVDQEVVANVARLLLS